MLQPSNSMLGIFELERTNIYTNHTDKELLGEEGAQKNSMYYHILLRH